jgi:hypothetical protein
MNGKRLLMLQYMLKPFINAKLKTADDIITEIKSHTGENRTVIRFEAT